MYACTEAFLKLITVHEIAACHTEQAYKAQCQLRQSAVRDIARSGSVLIDY